MTQIQNAHPHLCTDLQNQQDSHLISYGHVGYAMAKNMHKMTTSTAVQFNSYHKLT